MTTGRPSITDDNSRPERFKTTRNEVVCVFASCSFSKAPSTDPLHRVYTYGRCQSVLHDVKDTTTNDTVRACVRACLRACARACVSDLEEMGDAATLEKYYHSECLRAA